MRPMSASIVTPHLEVLIGWASKLVSSQVINSQRISRDKVAGLRRERNDTDTTPYQATASSGS